MAQCKKCKLFVSLTKDDIVKCRGDCDTVYHKKCVNKKFLHSAMCDNCQNSNSPKRQLEDPIIALNPNEESAEKVLAEINKKLAVIFSVEKKIEDLTNSVEFYAEMYQSLHEYKEESQKKIKALENRNIYLEKCTKALEERVQELEMQNKEKNIEIHGLEKQESENTKILIQNLAKKLNLDPQEVEDAKRVGSEKIEGSKPRVVLVPLGRLLNN